MDSAVHYEKTLSSEVIFEGRVITLTNDVALLENGETAGREVVHHHGGACILPYFEDGTLCMVRQFRYAMQQELWELPAGKLEKGEDPFLAAQRELEEIAQLHMNLVGPASARRITDLILDTLSRLERFPLSGHIPRDRELRGGGYRYVIAGKYICVYRLMAERVYVYHIAYGASNYPALFKRLGREEP